MSLLIWKQHLGLSDWGCDNCSFVVPKPRIGESLGEYVATSKTHLISTIVQIISVRVLQSLRTAAIKASAEELETRKTNPAATRQS